MSSKELCSENPPSNEKRNFIAPKTDFRFLHALNPFWSCAFFKFYFVREEKKKTEMVRLSRKLIL